MFWSVICFGSKDNFLWIPLICLLHRYFTGTGVNVFNNYLSDSGHPEWYDQSQTKAKDSKVCGVCMMRGVYCTRDIRNSDISWP